MNKARKMKQGLFYPKYIQKLILLLSLVGGTHSSFALFPAQMKQLSDSELSQVRGGALMSLGYTAPNDATNSMVGQGIGFYKLGMEAEIQLNANINKLQLGCGGMNGAGGCDIDIDNLSLSGIADTNTDRAASDAILTNPFIEFAIKNPDSASTRQIVGLRLSAEKLVGLLTAGTQNSNTTNGINSLSGYLKVQSGIGSTVAEQSKIQGYANTAAQYMDLSKYTIAGNLVALGLANASFITNGGGFNIPAMTNLPFSSDGQLVVNGNRQTSVQLNASVQIPTINLGTGSNYPSAGTTINDANGTTTAVNTAGSPVNAQITGCQNLTILPTCLIAWNGRQFNNINMSGSVSGATAAINFQEALGYFHKLQINSSASLSLQSIPLLWPGSDAANVAQPGWWMAFQDPISIGRVQPTQSLSIEPLLGQFAQKAGNYLQQNPAQTSDLLGVLTGSSLSANIGNVDLSQVTPLKMNLSNLQISNQNFAPNCYGSLKFC